MAKGKIDDLTYGMLTAVDGDADIPQATQRLEHLEMFTLLGDPALKLAATPADLVLKTDEAAKPGAAVTIHGTAPARLNGARVQVVAERPVSSTADGPGAAAERGRPGARPGDDAEPRAARIASSWQRRKRRSATAASTLNWICQRRCRGRG